MPKQEQAEQGRRRNSPYPPEAERLAAHSLHNQRNLMTTRKEYTKLTYAQDARIHELVDHDALADHDPLHLCADALGGFAEFGER